MNKHVTSLELSKRLKEKGVKQQSEFVYTKPEKLNTFTLRRTSTMSFKFVEKYNAEVYSAYLSSELGEMLPRSFCLKKGEGAYFIDYSNEHWEKYWNNYISNFKNNKELTPRDIHQITRADTEAEARGLMLCYLIDNELIEL